MGKPSGVSFFSNICFLGLFLGDHWPYLGAGTVSSKEVQRVTQAASAEYKVEAASWPETDTFLVSPWIKKIK